ncbi:hypothetical protein BS78_02G001100 [Paspalum vaginatum]|nr:hypothetical protein BS78_02G001100 [Paspalum vaginatum]
MAPTTHPLSWADAPPYHYHGGTPPPPKRLDCADGQGVRSLWIGGLLHWMDEDYLYACFTRSPELVSLVIRPSKQPGKLEGFGFLNFADHTIAAQILKSYNGQKMPNADQDFKLNWAAQQPAPAKLPDQDSEPIGTTQQDATKSHMDDGASSHHTIFVGDLAYDVTEYMLHHLFKARYPSVKGAKVIFDRLTGRSKGYGFVHFGDVNEQMQAMTEMNGAYCSTRPMRIGPAPNKKTFVHNKQGTDSYHDLNNSRIFVGHLNKSVTDEDLMQAFSPYGELVDVKILEGKGCGFVTYSNRASAEEAIKMLNGSQLGGNAMKLSWGRRSANKENQRNGDQYGRPGCFDSSSFGWSPLDPYAYTQPGHQGYGYYQPQMLPIVQ